MHPPAEEAAWRSIAPRLIAIVAAASLAAFLVFPPDLRPTVLRVALVAGLVILLFSLIGRMLGALRDNDPNGFEQALAPSVPPVRLDASLGQLRGEIRYSRSSHRYFEKVLWPRLRTLAARRGLATDDQPPPRPAGWLKRGPSVSDLNHLVDHLETRG